MTAKEKKFLMLTGIGGFIGALGVGIGEFMMQFTQGGKLDTVTYDYFLDVKTSHLSFGHFLCVLIGPLYFLGYVHLGRTLDKGRGWLGKVITGLGIYAFGVGIAWIGGRIYLGLTRKAVEVGGASPELFKNLAAHNEPFINVLRLAILVISILWVYSIVKGKSIYPKWMAIFSPFLILLSIFLIYAAAPAIGKYLLPAAMNVTHLLIFGSSLYFCSKITTQEN